MVDVKCPISEVHAWAHMMHMFNFKIITIYENGSHKHIRVLGGGVNNSHVYKEQKQNKNLEESLA